MKKVIPFLMGAMLAMPAFAQEEDMTQYIQNPGFDEDISFTSEGKPSKATTERSRTNASIWQVAEDGSIYTVNNEGWGSYNGFITRIKGWTVTNEADKPEWVYFGSVPYDLPVGALRCGRGSDKVTPSPTAECGSVECPAKPEAINLAENTGVLMLRAGWTNSCTYKQVVQVPCAIYRLEYWIYAQGGTDEAKNEAKNLTNVQCRKDNFPDPEGLNMTEWTKHSIEFTPTSEFTIEFGFKSANKGSGSNPIVWIDGIKLYKIGEADPAKIVEGDLVAAQDEMNELMMDATVAGLTGLVNELSDAQAEIDGWIGASKEEMEEALKVAEALIAQAKEAIAAAPQLEANIAKMEKLAATTSYPGLEALKAALDAAKKTQTSGSSADVLAAIESTTAAIRTYNLTQEATMDNPANYTFLVQAPWFIKETAEPVYEGGTYVFPNAENYTPGSKNDDLVSTGWYKSGADGGDQRLNWTQGRSCWNAWRSGFTDVIGIAQDLTDIPNGYYTVSGDLITQPGCITNQHVFVRSSVKEAISSTLTKDTWVDTQDGEWETLTTTDKVLVSDGKLTIGAESKGNGNGASGWFLVTNFRLQYYGPASAEDIKAAYDAKVSAADALLAQMHFAADKKAFSTFMEAYRNVGADAYADAISAIDSATVEAQKSEDKYTEYMMEGKTLPTVADSLGKNGYEAAYDIVKFAYDKTMEWINSDVATYTKLDSCVNLLKNYLNTYTPEYNKAATAAAAAKETGKAYLEKIMSAQKAELTSEMKDAETVNTMVEVLKAAVSVVAKQNVIDDANATDYTSFIQNPNAEAETGWTFNKGTGNTNTGGGQWYTGDTSVRYFDSWNGTAGALNYNAEQLVTALPNGTYTLGFYARTTAEGTFVFAGTNFFEVPLQYYTHIDDNTGDTVTEMACDKWGAIWEEAKAKIDGGMSEDDPAYAETYAIYSANNSNGCGWKHYSIENVEVTNHELLIGISTDSLKTNKPFQGTWFSVGGFTLTLTKKGDNTGWNGPVADGIENVEADGRFEETFFNINGVKMNGLRRGLNIIIKNGKAQKVFVK